MSGWISGVASWQMDLVYSELYFSNKSDQRKWKIQAWLPDGEINCNADSDENDSMIYHKKVRMAILRAKEYHG